jgi:hypothetical protein
MLVKLAKVAIILVASTAAAMAMAQPGDRTPAVRPGLNLPDSVQFVGPTWPRNRTGITIVNGEAITRADVDQRVALAVWLNSIRVAPGQAESFRARILRDLVDETLWLQAAAAAEIRVGASEVNRLYERVAGNGHRTPAQLSTYLDGIGSSDRALKRQLHAALAQRRLQLSQVSDTIPDEEGDMAAALASLTDPHGVTEYRAAEPDRIMLSLIRLSLALPADANQGQAQGIAWLLAAVTGDGGCGHALSAAWRSQAEIALFDRVAAVELPPELRRVILGLGTGMASQPFRAQDRVSVLILCGRDDLPNPGVPAGLTEQRIMRRAQRQVRELRRDAVIDYR